MSRGQLGARSRSNAIYGLADSVVPPLLLLAATPFLLHRLGLQEFGIWMLAAAAVGTVGFVATGFGDATVKYVAEYRAEGDDQAISRVVSNTLSLYGVLAGVLALALWWSASAVATDVLKLHGDARELGVHVIQLAGLGLLVQSIDSVFASTLRGLERYDLTVKVTVSERALLVAVAVVLAALGHGAVAILVSSVLISICGAAVQSEICRRMVPGLRVRPGWHAATVRRIGSFGFFSWMQGVGGILFSQADRLVVGATLGLREVSYYVICTQIAQQVHLLCSAGFHFVLPLVSRNWAGKGRDDTRRLYARARLFNVAAATGLAAAVLVGGRPFLAAWLGPAFAAHTRGLLYGLTAAFWLLAINVVPHNMLLAIDKVRVVALLNLAGGAATLVSIAVLARAYHLPGAGLGNLAYGMVISVNFVVVARSLSWFEER